MCIVHIDTYCIVKKVLTLFDFRCVVSLLNSNVITKGNMAKVIDMTGQRFGKLTVRRQLPSVMTGWPLIKGGAQWECVCDCGKVTSVTRTHLIHGNTKSCGCGRRGKRQSL